VDSDELGNVLWVYRLGSMRGLAEGRELQQG
jgi:hypothetical protein